jgi:predicted hotdog family 3-hydroxylacyl-ACP dehydratase
MTRCFAVDENNDLYINANGNLAIVNDLEATLQACAHSAKALLGEMVLNTNLGLPNFQTIWVGVPNVAQWEAALRVAFQNVEGVIGVQSLTITQEKETTGRIVNTVLSYVAVILTEFGVGTVNG